MRRKLIYTGLLVLSVGLFSCSAGDPASNHAEQKKIGSTLNSKQALAISEVPAQAMQKIAALYPEFIAKEVEKEFKHEKVYLDIEGEISGNEIEFDMLQTPEGWEIVEVQRDLVLADLPATVAQTLSREAPGFEPVRIIESKQFGTAITIYEFYAVSSNGVESRKEVMLENGSATLLQEEWQH